MIKRRANTVLCLLLLGASAPLAAQDAAWALCQAWPAPILDYPGAQRGADAPIYLSADASEGLNNEVVKLFGEVLVQRPDEQLLADEATYYRSTSTLDAVGNVRYETPEFSAFSDRAQIVADTDEGEFSNAEFFIYDRHARGSSTKILLQGDDLTVLKQSSYTTCDKNDEDWALRASTVKLDHAEGMGNAYNARLHFQGVPIFYIPYIRFPITEARMTGLLPPTWGSSDNGGNEFAQPLYLNLHPQLDLTITPHNYTERGLMWQNELRYLSRYGAGMINSENIDDELFGQDRSLYHYEHTGSLGTGWSKQILFNRVSDAEYFNDFGDSLSSSSTAYLERYAKLQYNDRLQHFMIQAQDFQIINPTSLGPYRRLPQLTYELSPPMAGPMRLQLESELVHFQRQDSITGQRANLTPTLSLPFERMAGYVTPKLSVYHTRYQLEDPNNTLADEELQRTVPISSLDTGIYLERETALGGEDYIHTLEPRLFYVYAPYRDQSQFPLFDTSRLAFSQSQLFSERRFTGLDRIGDTNQVTVSLTSRLLSADSGAEKLSGSLGKIVYLDDRRVGLNGNILDAGHQSDIIGEIQFTPNDDLRLTLDLLWDTDDDVIIERDVRLQYSTDNFHIFNVRYRDRGNRRSNPAGLSRELDTSVLWPLGTRWSMMARRYHSLEDDRTLEKMAGLEYSSCCWAFRFIRRAIFVNDASAIAPPFGSLRYSWLVQLELKGLTSVGKRIDEFMQDQILGYTPQ